MGHSPIELKALGAQPILYLYAFETLKHLAHQNYIVSGLTRISYQYYIVSIQTLWPSGTWENSEKKQTSLTYYVTPDGVVLRGGN